MSLLPAAHILAVLPLGVWVTSALQSGIARPTEPKCDMWSIWMTRCLWATGAVLPHMRWAILGQFQVLWSIIKGIAIQMMHYLASQ